MPKSSRYSWSSPKPEPPPKPRYKAKQAPLRIFVNFQQVEGDAVVVRRGCVLVADHFAARTWRREAFAYGLLLRAGGWLHYISTRAVLSIEYMDTDLPFHQQIDPAASAVQLADISPALVGVDLDVAWADPEKPAVVILRDPAFAAAVLAAHTPAAGTPAGWHPRSR